MERRAKGRVIHQAPLVSWVELLTLALKSGGSQLAVLSALFLAGGIGRVAHCGQMCRGAGGSRGFALNSSKRCWQRRWKVEKREPPLLSRSIEHVDEVPRKHGSTASTAEPCRSLAGSEKPVHASGPVRGASWQ